MIEHYPRGKKELLGPFHRFLCGDMMAWLSDHGVETKIEADGRVFPISNKSQDIINCFLSCCEKYNVQVEMQQGVNDISQSNKKWIITTNKQQYATSNVFMATGSSPAAWKIAFTLDHTIVPPVPSLFTFNIDSPLIKNLPGLSVPMAEVKLANLAFQEAGPLLITHWGLSGPAILKLSAWAARDLYHCDYQFDILVKWVEADVDTVKQSILENRKHQGKQLLAAYPLHNIPKRLWASMLFTLKLSNKNYASLTSKDMVNLTNIMCACKFNVNGKSTYKAEFVTCGGIDTKEVNFKTMESKLHDGLYFGGRGYQYRRHYWRL